MKGVDVEFIASDPWDFVTVVGSVPIQGEITGVSQKKDSILVKLDKPLKYKESIAQYLVISARHQGDTLKSMLKGKEVGCNVIGISTEQAQSDDPCDTSWWRGGGITSIGSVRKAKKGKFGFFS